MTASLRDLQNPEIIATVVRNYLEGAYTVAEVAALARVNENTAREILRRNIPAEKIRERKRLAYSRSKTAARNPMFGKFGKLHHNYKGLCLDKDGYLITLRPAWFKGKPSQKHVPVHHLIICEALGLTALPKNFVVHHVDEDRTNNALDNLALLTPQAHQRLHSGSHASKQLSLWELHQFSIWKSQRTPPSSPGE